MSDGAETDQLLWVVKIRTAFELLALEPRQIDQHLRRFWLAGER